jgi:lipid II:glycine glycyltransferase (peptidoglycan interpeptide bridge formation enzyme)
MKVEEITDKTIWEEFVSKQPMAPFLQSWAWGDFQQSIGHKVLRLGWEKGERLVAVALLSLDHSKLGNIAYVPYGPILDWRDTQLVEKVLQDLREKAVGVGADFLRVDPRVEPSIELVEFLKSIGFLKASHFVQPEHDLIVDLAKSDDDLLGDMRKTTRYLVRKAANIGIEVSWFSDPKELPVFLSLFDKTTKRQKFVGQSKDYLEKQFTILASAGIMQLAIAWYQGKPRSGAMIVFYADNAAYVHGASVENSDIPASYLLQWSALRKSREIGCAHYSFWGIASNEDSKDPLYGVSMFKRGFGGRKVSYIGAWDFPISFKYWVIRSLEIYRTSKQRFVKRLGV